MKELKDLDQISSHMQRFFFSLYQVIFKPDTEINTIQFVKK